MPSSPAGELSDQQTFLSEHFLLLLIRQFLQRFRGGEPGCPCGGCNSQSTRPLITILVQQGSCGGQRSVPTFIVSHPPDGPRVIDSP